MARIEWVHARLENWALWHDRMNSGGLGFATKSSFLVDPVDRQLEARLPVDEVDAGITDEAVTALLASHSYLHRTITLIYLTGCGVRDASRRMMLAESTVHSHLGRADQVLADWFSDRKRRKDAEAEAFRQQQQAARPKKLEGVVLPPQRRMRLTRKVKPSSSAT